MISTANVDSQYKQLNQHSSHGRVYFLHILQINHQCANLGVNHAQFGATGSEVILYGYLMSDYIKQYLYCYLSVQYPSNMESSRKMEITFLGNAQVGKTLFIQKLLKPKSSQMKDSSLAVDYYPYQRKIFSMGKFYQFKLFEVKGSESRFDNKYVQNQQLLLKNSELVIMVFDISNSQSFKDVGQFWLKFARENIKCKNIALLVNKVDKQSVLPLRNIYDFAKQQDLQPFFSSCQMDCVRVFDDIIIWHESKMEIQNLKKANNKQQINKVGGLMSKILGFTNSSPTKEDESLKKKKEQLQCLLLQKIIQIKKCFENDYKSIQNKLEEIYKSAIGVQIEIKNKQKLDIADVLRCIKDKMISLCKQVGELKLDVLKTRKQLIDKQLECGSRKQETQQKDNSIRQLQNLNQNLERQKQLIYNLNKKQKDQWQKKQEAFKKTIKQNQAKLKEESRILLKKIQKMEKQKVQFKKTKLAESGLANLAEQQTIKQSQQWKQRQNKYKQLIGNLKQRIFFEESRALRNLMFNNLQNIRNRIQKCQQKTIKQCVKIYQFDICCNQSFHFFLDSKSNILYVIELEEIIIVIYAEQSFKNASTGKKGEFLLYSKKQEEIIIFDLNGQAELWKYDPLALNFSKGEVVIKFNKNQCCLVLNQKKHNLFNDKKGSIFQYFRLPEKQDKSAYQIKSLQVLTVNFE